MIDSAKILAEIKANRTKLESCKKHSFAYPEDRPLQFGEKLTCTNCGGVMDAVQAFRYCEGGNLYRASLLPPYQPHLIKEGA